jgi:hypothetical protein
VKRSCPHDAYAYVYAYERQKRKKGKGKRREREEKKGKLHGEEAHCITHGGGVQGGSAPLHQLTIVS